MLISYSGTRKPWLQRSYILSIPLILKLSDVDIKYLGCNIFVYEYIILFIVNCKMDDIGLSKQVWR